MNCHYRHLCSYDHWLWLFVFFSGAALYLRFFPHLPNEVSELLLLLLLLLFLLRLLANPLPRQASLPSVSPILFASSGSRCAPLDLIPQGLSAVCTPGPHPPGSDRSVHRGASSARVRSQCALLVTSTARVRWQSAPLDPNRQMVCKNIC